MPLALMLPDQYGTDFESMLQASAGTHATRQSSQELDSLPVIAAQRLFLNTVGDHAGDDVLGESGEWQGPKLGSPLRS
jgi:hypothetical protein